MWGNVDAAEKVHDLWTTAPGTGGTVFPPSTFRSHHDSLPKSEYSAWSEKDPYKPKPVLQGGGYKPKKRKTYHPPKTSLPLHTAPWRDFGNKPMK